MSLTHLDLFAGIGGFSLAARKLGIATTTAVEIGDFQRSLLKIHFPETELWDDIQTFEPHGKFWDIATFGSPCQNLSSAGKREGIGGDRSSLFFDAMRIVEESRPTFLVWENVEGAIGRGLRAVLGAFRLAGYEYDDPQIVSAAELGAPHRRKRLLVVAYPAELQQWFERAEGWADQIRTQVAVIANTFSSGWQGREEAREQLAISPTSNTNRERRQRENPEQERFIAAGCCSAASTANGSFESGSPLVDDGIPDWLAGYSHYGWWAENPAPRTVGINRRSLSNRYQYLESIGNAIAPQVAEVALRRCIYLNQFIPSR